MVLPHVLGMWTIAIADDLRYMHDVKVTNDKCGMVDQVSTGYTKQICQAATFLKNFKICSGRLFRRSGPSWMIPGQCTQKLVGHTGLSSRSSRVCATDCTILVQ